MKTVIKESISLGLIYRFSPLSSWWEACWHAGRHGAGQGVEHFTSRSASNRQKRTVSLA